MRKYYKTESIFTKKTNGILGYANCVYECDYHISKIAETFNFLELLINIEIRRYRI